MVKFRHGEANKKVVKYWSNLVESVKFVGAYGAPTENTQLHSSASAIAPAGHLRLTPIYSTGLDGVEAADFNRFVVDSLTKPHQLDWPTASEPVTRRPPILIQHVAQTGVKLGILAMLGRIGASREVDLGYVAGSPV